MKKNKLRSLFLLVMLLCFGILLMGFSTKTSKTQKDETLEVHFIDVGQGDCTLIKTGDHAMLIDAGDNDQGTKVQLYLKKQNVEKLDYAVCTHPEWMSFCIRFHVRRFLCRIIQRVTKPIENSVMF